LTDIAKVIARFREDINGDDRTGDAMREVIERYRKMAQAGTRLIFGDDAAQWNANGTPVAPLA
jgi:hypothetical protein